VGTEADIVGSFAHFVGTVLDLWEIVEAVEEVAVPTVVMMAADQAAGIADTIRRSLVVNAGRWDHTAGNCSI
jgi:hypothetical protein